MTFKDHMLGFFWYVMRRMCTFGEWALLLLIVGDGY